MGVHRWKINIKPYNASNNQVVPNIRIGSMIMRLNDSSFVMGTFKTFALLRFGHISEIYKK